MSRVSRRQLANWAITELGSGRSAKALGRQLAAELVESGRAKDAQLLIDDILSQLEISGQLAAVNITTATKIPAELKKSLVNYAKKASGVKQTIATETIDPEVLGGFKIETTTKTWDKTVARQLAEIKGGL